MNSEGLSGSGGAPHANPELKPVPTTDEKSAAKERTLRILCQVVPEFRPYENEVSFVGGIAKWLNDELAFEDVHDIDVLITGKNMAAKFWELVRSLIGHDIRPNADLEKRPTGVPDWKYCLSEKWNVRTFSSDCTKEGTKEYLLDIFFDDDLFQFVPEANLIGAVPVPLKVEGSPHPVVFSKAVDKIQARLLKSR